MKNLLQQAGYLEKWTEWNYSQKLITWGLNPSLYSWLKKIKLFGFWLFFALYSPPRCYLVNLNYWLPRSGSSFPSKQKSRIKETNWPNLFKSLSNLHVYTLNDSMRIILILYDIIPLQVYTFVTNPYWLSIHQSVSTTLLAFFACFAWLSKFKGVLNNFTIITHQW